MKGWMPYVILGGVGLFAILYMKNLNPTPATPVAQPLVTLLGLRGWNA